ncbi:MAG: hypothetical protein U7126_29080 [Microcoleus sp.]
MKSIEYISQVVDIGELAWGIGRSEAEGWGIGHWALVLSPRTAFTRSASPKGEPINSVEVSPSETNFLPKVESVLWLLLPEKLCPARWIALLFCWRAAG